MQFDPRMAGDDLLDAYIAEALKSTGTRKASNAEVKPAAEIRRAEPPAPSQRPAPATTPPPTARTRTASVPPHSVVARTSSQIRTPAPSNEAPAVGRTPTPSGIRARTPSVPPTFDDSPLASIDRARRPTPPPPIDRTRMPAVARTRSESTSPLAIARARDLAMQGSAPVEPLPRTRAPHASSTMLPQADDLDCDFGEDTVPEVQALTALTDQDDRGVRRS